MGAAKVLITGWDVCVQSDWELCRYPGCTMTPAMKGSLESNCYTFCKATWISVVHCLLINSLLSLVDCPRLSEWMTVL
jgi:hypothetical protein